MLNQSNFKVMYTIKFYSRFNHNFRISQLGNNLKIACRKANLYLLMYNQNEGKEYQGFWATIHYNPGDTYEYETERQIGYIDYDFEKGENLIYLYDIYGEIQDGRTWNEV